ncbi:hypothetical protein [Micromonospora sp. DT62]|uniref:hypothetical protein n=1 Tax=Micromonospora sp. DT62 TaxID=3416521 RepID=UPI003CF04292
MTSTVTDVPGASITLSTTTAGARYIVDGSFDISQLATTNNDITGWLDVDGALAGRAVSIGGQVFGDRATGAQTWVGTLPAAGSHTFKLRASTTTAGQYQVNQTNTSLVIMIFEVV